MNGQITSLYGPTITTEAQWYALNIGVQAPAEHPDQVQQFTKTLGRHIVHRSCVCFEQRRCPLLVVLSNEAPA